MERDPPEYSVVCSGIELEDDSDLSETIEKILELEFPDRFRWRDTYIDPDSLDEFQFIISTGSPETPQFKETSDKSVFLMEWVEDKGLHVHSYINEDEFSALVDLHADVARLFDGVQINHGSVSIQLPKMIDEYPIYIEPPLGGDMRGVEFMIESDSVSIFRHSDDSFISYTNFESYEDLTDISEFVFNTKSKAEQVLEEITS